MTPKEKLEAMIDMLSRDTREQHLTDVEIRARVTEIGQFVKDNHLEND